MISRIFKGFFSFLSIAKKVLIVFIVFIFIIQVFMYFISGRNKNTNTHTIEHKRNELYKTFEDPELLATKEGRQYIGFIKKFSCWFIGEGCTDNPNDGNKYMRESIMWKISSIASIPYSSPVASGLAWAEEGLHNAGFIPKTYAAQGIGFHALKPFQGVWLMFRDFMLLIMVLIIVAIGFMIMFRAKIDSQTAINIQNALPKIIFALIAITFSYAIAGFLIDLMYILIGLVIGLMNTNQHFLAYEYYKDSADLYERVFLKNNLNFTEVTKEFDYTEAFRLSVSLYDIMPPIIQFFLGSVGPIIGFEFVTHLLRKKFPTLNIMGGIANLLEHAKKSGQPILSLVAGIIYFVIELVVTNLFGFLFAWVIIFFLLMLSLIVIILRIFFMLLFAYVRILLLVIFSPVILAFEAIPGKNAFIGWLKALAFNIMTFPLVLFLALIVQVIISIPTDENPLWRPPFLYEIDATAFPFVVAGVLLFSIPDIVAYIKKALGDDPQNFGLNPMNMFAGLTAMWATGYGLMAGYSNVAAGLRGIGERFGGIGGKIQNVLSSSKSLAESTAGPNTTGEGGGT